MKLAEFARIVLEKASAPMTAKEVWEEGVRLGLDQQLETAGKTPEESLGALLYVRAKKNSECGFVGDSGRPKRFRYIPSVEPTACEEAAPTEAREARAEALSFLECAEKVLLECGNKAPMHYREITRIGLEKGWLVTNGRTPEATMNAQICTDISRKQKVGEVPRFVKHGRGYFGLSCWMPQGLSFLIAEHEKEVRKQLRDFLCQISSQRFDELVQLLLEKMGFEEISITPLGGDGGIDVRGTWVIIGGVRIRMAVLVKRWRSNAQRAVVQSWRGRISSNERGLIMTCSDFSPSARKEAEDPTKMSPISLINGEQLVDLFIEHDIGIRRETVDILELDTTDLDAGTTGDGA